MSAESGDALTGPDTDLEHMVAVVETGDPSAISAAVASLHPADLAELLNILPHLESRKTVFGLLPVKVAATVVARLAPPARTEILESRSDDELRSLVEELDSDEAADLLESVPKDRAQTVLQGLPGSVAARIQQLLKYPADTAGGLMKSEYAAVLEGATVEEAVEIVRTLAEAVADIHNVLVVDHRFHLLGVLPLSRLILARAGETVDAVMDRQVISVTVDTDQEEVARLFRKYDLVSLAGHRSPRRAPRPDHCGRHRRRARGGSQRGFLQAVGSRRRRAALRLTGTRDQAAAAVARTQPVHDQPERQRDRAVRGDDSQPRRWRRR